MCECALTPRAESGAEGVGKVTPQTGLPRTSRALGGRPNPHKKANQHHVKEASCGECNGATPKVMLRTKILESLAKHATNMKCNMSAINC